MYYFELYVSVFFKLKNALFSWQLCEQVKYLNTWLLILSIWAGSIHVDT